jgi:transcriptional regulator of acetoin/glycerol metabolism
MRVHPDRLDLPYVRQPDTDSRLAHAAEPVLHGITQDVTTEAMTVILTSADGVVIQRSASESAFMKALDSVSLAPGYSYAEEFAGTNGIGTTLETGRPTFIRGGEHFVGSLGELACAGAPIRDPITQRLVGVVDLTCRASRSNPVLLPLVKSLGSQIEDRMRDSAHESEIALLDAYQHQARGFPFGVLAIGGDVLLMNRYLRQTLTPTIKSLCSNTPQICFEPPLRDIRPRCFRVERPPVSLLSTMRKSAVGGRTSFSMCVCRPRQ